STGTDLIAYVETPAGDLDATRVRFATGRNVDDFRASFVVAPLTDRLRLARDGGLATWVSSVDDPGAIDDFVYAPVYGGAVDAEGLSTPRRRDLLRGFIVVRTDLQQALEASTDAVVDRRSAA